MYSDEAKPTARNGIWRIGDSIGVREGIADFPEVCVICGVDQNCKKYRCNLRTKPGLWTFFFPLLAMFNPSIRIEPYLCQEHANDESNKRHLGNTMLFTGILFLSAPFVSGILFPDVGPEILGIFMIGLLSINAWLYYILFRKQCVTALLIRGRDAVIEDIPYPLLQALPTVEG